jgi:hypothetical protein
MHDYWSGRIHNGAPDSLNFIHSLITLRAMQPARSIVSDCCWLTPVQANLAGK